MEKSPIRHRVEHTRNKHSRAVYSGNTIIIRLARNLSKTEEQEHVRNLLRRMKHLVLQERSKTVIDPFRALFEGAQTTTVRLTSGKRVVFALYPSASASTRARATATGWRVDVGPRARRRSLHRLLWSLLAQSEQPRMESLVRRINEDTFGSRITEVRLAFASTQWGSCSPKGVIMLNAALLFVPPSLLKYVIVHELAHRIVPNHSAAYWRTVERVMPGYEKQYKELQNYRLPQL